jgi:hypothetical protein
MPLSGQIRDTWRTKNAISNIGVKLDLANASISISILDPIIEQFSGEKDVHHYYKVHICFYGLNCLYRTYLATYRFSKPETRTGTPQVFSNMSGSALIIANLLMGHCKRKVPDLAVLRIQIRNILGRRIRIHLIVKIQIRIKVKIQERSGGS